jgi:hypothetical protein
MLSLELLVDPVFFVSVVPHQILFSPRKNSSQISILSSKELKISSLRFIEIILRRN